LATITIPASYANTTKRLVFTWRNDSVNPRGLGALDNISLTSQVPATVTLPYSENFDSSPVNTNPAGWTVLNTNGDINFWTNQTQVPQSSPNAMMVYTSGIASNDWLVTPPIALESGKEYKIRFNYRAGNSSYSERLQLRMASSGTSAALTAGTQLFDNAGFNNLAYQEVVQTFIAPTTGNYYLGWQAYSAANKLGILIDDFYIAANPPSAGVSETSVAFGLTDIGSGSAAHQFRIYNLGGGTLTLPQAPFLYGGDTTQFSITDTNEYPVVLAGNEFISIDLYCRPNSTGLKSSTLYIQDNLGSKYYYPVPLSGTGAHIRFQDSFETNPNFNLSFTNWTQHDGDLSATYGLTGYTYDNQYYTGSYIAFNPSASDPALGTSWNAYSGSKYAACFVATTPPNNDWLISPQINFGLNPRISFKAKSYTSYYGLERFKVLYSTTGNNYTDFTSYLAGSAVDYVTAPTSWTNFEYALPDSCANRAVYFAIQCVSNDAFVFMIDDFVAGDYGLPVFGVDPVDYTFTDFYIDYNRTTQIKIFNAGGGAMQIVAGGITISGSPYIKLYDLPTLPLTLNATESISFTVGYNSPEGGSHSAEISITDNLTKNVNTVNIYGTTTDNTITQKPYFEGFEPYVENQISYQVYGWVRRDNDLDGNTWLLLNDPAQAKSGNWCAASLSWVPDSAKSQNENPDHFLTSFDETNSFISPKSKVIQSGRAALTPDNWLISPPITISRGDSLSYWVGSYSAIDYAEHYSVLISTTTPDPLQFTTVLYEETLASAAWAYHAFDLDDYQGQTVYFAIRHIGSTDMLALKIDDFKVKSYNTEIYQDYVGDPVEGNNYFSITMNPIQDEIHNIPLEVIIEAWLPASSSALVTGYVGFANPLVTVNDAGLTIRVEGVNMAGATVRITHNLGYIPQQLGYRNLLGTFSFITSSTAQIWNSTQVKFVIPSAKAGEGMEFVFPSTQDGTLPVELSHFSANLSSNNQVQIIWVSQTETNLIGYRIYRGTNGSFADAIMLESLIAATNTSQMQTYLFTDYEAYGPNTYYYWLEHLEMDGSSVMHGPVVIILDEGSGQAPQPPIQKGIASVFPNPFNPDTSIRFGLSEKADYSLKIFNQKGQLVRNLASGNLNRGYYTLLWNGRDNNGSQCASGHYFVHFSSGNDSFIRKITMVK